MALGGKAEVSEARDKALRDRGALEQPLVMVHQQSDAVLDCYGRVQGAQ